MNRPAHTRQVYPAKEQEDVSVLTKDLLVDGVLHIYPEVTGKNYFRIHLKDDRLIFQAGGYVGLIPINDRVAIDVRPRVPLDNLERILSFVEQPLVPLRPHRRSYETGPDQFGPLLDFLAQELLISMTPIEADGLHQEYLSKVQDTSFPRGRIAVGRTMQRHTAKGMGHRVAATWFERTNNTAANQCLKYTLWYLAEHYRGIRLKQSHRKTMTALNRLYMLFDDVDLDKSRSFLTDPCVSNPSTIPALRAYYRRPIETAKTIIRDMGITFDGRKDEILLSSLLVNVSDAFENYVRKVLSMRFRSKGIDMVVLDGNKNPPAGASKPLFAGGGKPIATPDIVCTRTNASGNEGELPIVLEVKYKPTDRIPDRDDLNQAVTYGTSYKAPHVVLVHPKPSSGHGGLLLLGQMGAMTVYGYGYDLASGNIEGEEQAFADSIARLAKV